MFYPYFSIMINIIIYLLVGSFIGAGLCYLCFHKKLKCSIELNEYIRYENEKIEHEHNELLHKLLDIKNDYQYWESEKDHMIHRADDARRIMEIAEQQARDAAEKFYEQHMANATEKMNHSLEQEAMAYQKSIEQFQQEAEQIKIDKTTELQQFIGTSIQTEQELKEKLQRLRSAVDAAVAAAKRAEELKEQVDFYRLHLTETDIKEIEMLRSVIPYLRDKESLNKIIWKVFYEKPTTDLIGRVVGSGTHTGIYKITNIENQMCYVGQAANIADRWKQHIKRGVGAETPTRNKLYPVMFELGPENFTFEVIEECDRSRLDEREDYWQDYFKAKEFGYSIK